MTNLVRLTLPSMSASATAPIEVLRLPAGVHGSELVRDALTDILNGVTGPAVAFVADGPPPILRACASAPKTC